MILPFYNVKIRLATNYMKVVMNVFIGRKRELEQLNELYESNRFEYAAVYGNIHVGKTTLIKEFCKGKKFIYYQVTNCDKDYNLAKLSEAIYDILFPNMIPPIYTSFTNLFNILDNLNKRIILVIDEYPLLAVGFPPISSIIQNHIDLNWREHKLMLILISSSIRFMQFKVLGYKSPLYGRNTCQFRIYPFRFSELKQLHWSYSPQELAVLYAITNGVPAYLKMINPTKTVKENIINLYLSNKMISPFDVLKYEFLDIRPYQSILSCISKKAKTIDTIKKETKLKSITISNVIYDLLEMKIIKKEIPYGENEQSKNTLYLLSDFSFMLWFRFLCSSDLNYDTPEAYYQKMIEPELDNYMETVFISICQEYMYHPIMFKNAPFFYSDIRCWWNNKTVKRIDVFAEDHEHVILGKCKWTNDKIDKKVLDDLLKQGTLFKQEYKYYYLFSKNGFTDAVIDYVNDHTNVSLITIEDIYQSKLFI